MDRYISVALIGILLISIVPMGSSISHFDGNPVDMVNRSSYRATEYQSFYGPVAVLFEQYNDYYIHIIPEFISLLDEYYDEVIVYTAANYSSSPFYAIAENFSEYAGYMGAFFDLGVFINPEDGTPLREEYLMVKKALSYGKSLMITGDWYRYFDKQKLNPFTEHLGISWYDDEVLDLTNNFSKEYYPWIHTWKNNGLSRLLTGDNSSLEVSAASSTCLEIQEEYNNTNGIVIYPVGTGDDDTYTKYNSSSGTNITIYLGVINVTSSGKLFVSGGTTWLSNKTDNGVPIGLSAKETEYFVRNIISWFNSSLDDVVYPINITLPKILYAGTKEYLFMDIKNLGASNRQTTLYIETYGSSNLKINSTQINLGIIAPKSKKNVALSIETNTTGIAMINITTVAVNPSNTSDVVRYSKIVPLRTLAFRIEASKTKDIMWLHLRNRTTIKVKITNLAGVDSTNTKIYASAPSGISLENIPIYVGDIAIGSSVEKNVSLTVLEAGIFDVELIVKSDQLEGRIVVRIYAYEKPIAVFANNRNSYFNYQSWSKYGNMTDFVNNYLGQYFGVYIVNETGDLTDTVLSDASLLVLPRIDADGAFTEAENESIMNFVDNGGCLIVLGDGTEGGKYFNPSYINSLLREYGMEFLDSQLVNINGTDPVYEFEYYEEGPAEYINYKISLSSVYKAAVINIISNLTIREGNIIVRAYPVISGGPNTLVNISGESELKNDTTKIILAVAELSTGGKIVVFGSNDMFSYTNWARSDRLALIGNIFAWMYGNISISVASLVELNISVTNKIPIVIENIGPVGVRRIGISVETDSSILLLNTSIEVIFLDAGGTKKVYLSVVPQSMGTFSMTIYYIAGGLKQKSVSISIKVTDKIPPTINIKTPTNNTRTSSKKIIVEFNVSDNYNLKEIKLYLDGNSILTETISGNFYNKSITLDLTTGEHTIKIMAYDEYQNMNQIVIKITVEEAVNLTVVAIISGVIIAGVAGAGILYWKKKKQHVKRE
ncbi:MAG: Ig-like domain-containing protein [Candidatus Njordarchaeota archaeon]